MALSTLTQRVSQAMMNSFCSKAVTSSLLKTKIWVVPKQLKPCLTEEQKQALIHPQAVTGGLAGLDVCRYWLLDQVIPREQLGVGTREFEISVGTISEATLDGAREIPSASIDGPRVMELTANARTALTALRKTASKPSLFSSRHACRRRFCMM